MRKALTITAAALLALAAGCAPGDAGTEAPITGPAFDVVSDTATTDTMAPPTTNNTGDPAPADTTGRGGGWNGGG